VKQNESLIVRTGEQAPDTTLKSEIIQENRSRAEKLVVALGEMVKDLGPKQQVILAVDDVLNWINKQDLPKDEIKYLGGQRSVRKLLKAAGLFEPERKPGATEQQRFKIEGRKSYVMANFKIAADKRWDDIKGDYKKPVVADLPGITGLVAW
jgi:hypothetical protein